MEAIYLLKNITTTTKQLNLFVNLSECRGGPLVKNIFADAIQNFEKYEFSYGIITYNQFSYGLLRLNNVSGPSSYAFFDSHGRKDDGSRPGSKSAVLFFENSLSFIDFF